jgi:hypothetical protein
VVDEEVVGPIQGPISALGSNQSARYQPSSAAYTVALAGLPFQKWVEDEHPYARQTAEFRRQQIDQSSQPGDQSLVGFWTRGQLSFHHGAGVNFYELTDGETVLNRFTSSVGCDVWTPGRVTVRPKVSNIYGNATRDVVLFDGKIALRRSTGAVETVTYTGTSASLPLTAGGVTTSITSDGVNLYATNAGKIDKCAPGGSFTTLWTHHTGGKTFQYVWWAKSRLWALDSDGNLFTLSTAGGTTAAGDILWAAPYSATARWSLTESEGAVFLAVGDAIFAASIDGSAATPVVGAPLTVARVGAQETIGAIGAYLGYLTVASSAGVRVGRIGDNGLLLGDLIYEWSGQYCTRLAFKGSRVLVTTSTATETAQVELDLLEQVSDLQPAWAQIRTAATSGTDSHGSLVLPDGRTAYFRGSGIWLTDETLGTSSGTIRTGFHRFGTLELKDFRTLSVFVQGAAGTVGVALVDRDGDTHPLVTLGTQHFGSNEVAFNLAEPIDCIGLEFTITSEDDVAPTLLGYQIRALPAPTRQRLIQIPLMCFDTEHVGNTEHGYRGWARDRLFELEEMERTSGAITYQDFELDETAVVAIEDVRFQSKTPMKGGNGFGGLIVVTLRKVT